MIYNRTQDDITAALAIRENKIKKFLTLTDADIQTLEKGFLTHTTLNRIEDKQEELENLVHDLGYWNTEISNKDWTLGDIFNLNDHERILKNLDNLRNAFFTKSDTPRTPEVSYHYESINSIEKILDDIDIMINNVKSNYRECGAYNCGGE